MNDYDLNAKALELAVEASPSGSAADHIERAEKYRAFLARNSMTDPSEHHVRMGQMLSDAAHS
jgi:hypothetical protein